MDNKFYNNNKARNEQPVESEVNAAPAEELQVENNNKFGFVQDHKGAFVAGGGVLVLAGAVAWAWKKGWIKWPFKKKAQPETKEEQPENAEKK